MEERIIENNEESLKKPDEIRKEADLLKKLINNASSDLKSLQEDCRHKDWIIAPSPSKPGQPSIVKICKHCDRELGYASEQQLKDAGYM